MESTITSQDLLMELKMIFHMVGKFKGVYLDREILIFLTEMGNLSRHLLTTTPHLIFLTFLMELIMHQSMRRLRDKEII